MYAVVLILNAHASKDLILTYKIREGTLCLPGMLFSVPVKQHQESALVLRVQSTFKGSFEVRPLGEVQMQGLVLPRASLALMRWISRHYLTSLSRAAGLVLPPPVRSTQMWRYYWQEERSLLFESEDHQEWWAALKKAGKRGLSSQRIKQRWNKAALDQFDIWHQQGSVRREATWKEAGGKAREDALADLLSADRHLELEPFQQAALETVLEDIDARCHGEHLLFGVTGSGKTEVYLQAARQAILQGRQVLYLVPEISLVPQVTAKAKQWFGSAVAVLHSALTPAQRYEQWMRIHQQEAMIVVGPRSAIFAPVMNLGLIIIDEEHEHTYKQAEPEPRYDARETARWMARYWRGVLIRGSATPDIETYYDAVTGRIKQSLLSQRIQQRPMPEITWVDMKKELKEGHGHPLSRPLLVALNQVLEKKEQAILLMNRRGFHSYLLCRDCGQRVECPHCSIAMTYHRQSMQPSRRQEGYLLCHYCNYQLPKPSRCPHCGSPAMQYMGTGTERVVDDLTRALPKARVLRMDMDTTRTSGSHTEILKAFQNYEADILVGTQMVAKGFDFARVTLAAVLHIDGVLNIPDFRSGEKAFQLMIQTAGRAGRGDMPGQMLVQTFLQENPVLQEAATYNYGAFYEREIALREALGYPPFRQLARVLISGPEEEAIEPALKFLMEKAREALGTRQEEIQWLGPVAAPVQRIKNRYRGHMILLCTSFPLLKEALVAVRESEAFLKDGLRLMLDVSPKNLI